MLEETLKFGFKLFLKTKETVSVCSSWTALKSAETRLSLICVKLKTIAFARSASVFGKQRQRCPNGNKQLIEKIICTWVTETREF